MVTSDKTAFYETDPVTIGADLPGNRTYIANQNLAHEVALAERDEGRVAAQAREDYLRSTYEAGGYTPEQQNILKLMDILSSDKKYPHAFIKRTASNGTPVWITNQVPHDRNLPNRYVYTPYGIAGISLTPDQANDSASYGNYEDIIEHISADELLREVQKPPHAITDHPDRVNFLWKSKEGDGWHEDFYVRRLKLEDIANQDLKIGAIMKETLMAANEAQISKESNKSQAQVAILAEKVATIL